jgi:Polyketide cyclase / dehydrase and lipid transport
MPAYRFCTTWVLEADRERVWDAIYDSDSWPEWWRGIKSTKRLSDGDADGLGQRGVYEWRARIPYTVQFEIVSTIVERPHRLGGEASGELAGTGLWRFYEERGTTAVVYDWNVRTTKPGMNLLGPVGKPVFRANHDWVMRNGGEGLARRLGVRLLVNG